jgi:hypothetical protein
MKRSRRVVLTMMGSAAVSAATARLAVARPVSCGPGYEAVPGPHGFANCQARIGGFGGSFHHFHGSHAHGGHAGG